MYKIKPYELHKAHLEYLLEPYEIIDGQVVDLYNKVEAKHLKYLSLKEKFNF